MTTTLPLAVLLRDHAERIQSNWLKQLAANSSEQNRSFSTQQISQQASGFLAVLLDCMQNSNQDDIRTPEWDAIRDALEELSSKQAAGGFSADETAFFIFSLKRPMFDAIREAGAQDPVAAADFLNVASDLIDKLGLHTVKVYQKAREAIINRQQEEMLELSTPVVKLWDGILALPMIGTLDSARTQVVMESLLQKIVDTDSQVAIIDITGVPTVDTLVAQHLLKTVAALRLMGAECIISGVRPQIAQTIVHLGVDLQGVATKANLADALALALSRTGVTISKA